ncbi:MAG: flagellin FliC [Planctomycetes bacterium]|nr:flagellin FliC [Planctomycetota bacterium]
MGLRVNTNVAALTSQRNLSAVTARLQGNFSRLSSGLRIATAADDAAGLGISERMRGQIRSYTVAMRNSQDGVSLAQTAEGALQEVSNNLTRMRELAVQASNGTLTTADRATLNTEFQALVTEIGRVSSQTTFNGVNLLDGSTSSLDVQVGIDANETISVSLSDITSTTLGINSSSITSASNASTAISAIDGAIDDVTEARGDLGATMNRMTSAIASILNTRDNLSAAESRIRDVDIATETSDLTRNSILQQAAISVLSQANVQPQLALQLLN